MQWSKIKARLENLLADKLQGNIQIHSTIYRRGADDEIGRLWVTLSKQQIFSAGDAFSPQYDEWYLKENCVFFNNATAHHRAANALFAFLDLSVEEALSSNQEIIKAWAMFDKRVGKRRLGALSAIQESESLLVRHFYTIRCREEGLYLC